MSKLSEQRWYCEGCRNYGIVKYPVHADVFVVVNKIDESHHLSAPNCERGVEQIRVPQDQEALDDLIRLGNQYN